MHHREEEKKMAIEKIETGSGNVFADVGFTNAATISSKPGLSLALIKSSAAAD